MGSEGGEEVHDAPTGDLVWYSRLLVWVGAGILLLEALTGRSTGVTTAMATIVLAAGTLGFFGGLAGLDRWGRPVPENERLVDGEAVPTDEHTPPNTPIEQGAPLPVVESRESESESSTMPDRPQVQAPERTWGATTAELKPGDAALEIYCLSCGQSFRVGQLAATCRECSAVQHASCWTQNRSQCARPGCGGHGSLLAPDDLSSAELGPNPEWGPSKP